MGVPPASENPPHYTVPTIADPSSEANGTPTYVSDTFNIAKYLDEKYPAPRYPVILPQGTLALQKTFVDNFATIGGPLFQSFIRPYFPSKYLTEPALNYLICSRGVTRESYSHLKGEEATNKLAEIRQKWEGLAENFKLNNEGIFAMGKTISFADFAVGGMLFALNRAEGDNGEVWKEVMQWSGGRWCEYWNEIKAIKDGKSAEVV
ncbi:glutathione S-transferase [Ceratobasidium sp. AG-Ba]|nr:glutathione S-transferase [Ceratobasidium sp. AG-Ba]